MSHRPSNAMDISESELIDRSHRSLEDGTKKDPVEKLRLLCLARGVNGMIGLGRAFRRMDDDGNKYLSLEEFIRDLHDTGLECTDEEAAEIFERYSSSYFKAENQPYILQVSFFLYFYLLQI